MKLKPREICRYLEWDSDFFGYPIGSVDAHTVTRKSCKQILEWCEKHKIRCLYFLADPKDAASLRLTESLGFELIDIRLTLEYNTRYSVRIHGHTMSQALNIREVKKDDFSVLFRMVVQNHFDSRFYRDTRFSKNAYRRLYTYWIEKECNEKNTHVFIATYNSIPVGYITCKILPDGEGVIGLSGVDKKARNLGVGTTLVERALKCFSHHRCTSIKVVTQGINIKAQRLYTSNGFYPYDIQLWYHKWFAQEQKGGRKIR